MTLVSPAWMRGAASLFLIAALLPWPASRAHSSDARLPAEPAPQSARRAGPVLFFVADGGQPDYFRQFAAAGLLPAFARLEAIGAMSPRGMAPQLPTSTRVGWQTLSTGAWAGTHGALNNVYTRHGLPMGEFAQAGVYAPLEAQTLAEAAETAGLNVLMYDWNSSDQPAIAGPTVRYWRTYTRAGVAQNYDAPRQAAGAQAWGMMFDRLTLSPVSAAANAPATFSPIIGTRLRLNDFLDGAYEYGVLLYDSTNDGRINYDRARVSSARGQEADLALGDWAEIRVSLLTGREQGKTAGFYLKLMELEPDLRQVKFFVSAVSRVNAQPEALEDYLADNFPTRTGASGALAWEELIDEATYAQAADLTMRFNRQALPWLLGEYAPDTDLAMVGYLNTDVIQHAVLALLTPGSPVYDDANRDGQPDGRLEERLAHLHGTYIGADETLAAAWNAMPADTTVVAASDHGFAPTWKAVYAPHVLAAAGMQPDPQNSNCLASDRALAKACWVGGTAMIYMNVQGREPHGVVAPADYAAVRERIRDAWLALRGDDGQPIVHAVYTLEEAGALPSGHALASMAHPDKTGDLIVFLRLPYQFDFAEGGTPVRDTTVWWGAHGHLPQSGDGVANTNLFATFYLAGPRVRRAQPTDVRSIDLAPTLAHILGIRAPAQSEGRVLRNLLDDGRCLSRWHPSLRIACSTNRGR